MKQSTEELKKILADAPEGATHYDGKSYFAFIPEFDDGLYYSHWRKWVNNKKSIVVYQSRGINNIRSLSDIKEIVELREKLDGAFVVEPNEEVAKLTAKQLGIE